jgi:hypothetical protein
MMFGFYTGMDPNQELNLALGAGAGNGEQRGEGPVKEPEIATKE